MSHSDRYLRCHKDDNSGSDRVCTLSVKHLLTRTCCLRCGRRHSNYLILLYVFVKFLYLVNAVGQIFLLDLFLGGSAFHAYGIDVLRGAVDLESDWPETGSARFPRVTMCDVKIRRLGNVHRYTVQCVLPINAFSEKIFLFFWFWFVFVAISTLVSLVLWIVRFTMPAIRSRYVKQHIEYIKKPKDSERRKVKKFIHSYLNQDGVFILRLMTHNTSTITTTEFVYSLWEHYRKKADDHDEVDC